MEATAPLLAAEAPAFTAPEVCSRTPRVLLRIARLELREPQVRLVGIVLLAGLLNLLHYRGGLWYAVLALKLFCVGLCWEGNRQIFFALRRRYPNYESTARRLVWQVLLSLVFTLVASVGFTLIQPFFEPVYSPSFWASYQHCLLFSLIPTTVVMTIYESAYFFSEWKRYYLRAAWLEKEHAVSQLAALKQQVDPHFLFNTLNTLAALVGDNAPAQEFLDEMANVYRYVLSRKDLPTVTVAEEMAFVESYVYLTRIRHQEAVCVSSHLPAEVLARHVPPLAIQMLVENAIKHNTASARRPLHIELRAENDYVCVSNNVQPKTTLARGQGVGLRNLRAQFQLLAGREVLVQPGPARFAVQLPLLSSHAGYPH